MNSCIQSLMNSSIKKIHFPWLCSYVLSLGTNIHKQELFVMAIRTPTGKTFSGNYTIIPSSKKWVFHSIFCLAFMSLYGEHICSMNQLVLPDEEDAEYRAFESVIATHDAFLHQKSCCALSMLFGNPLNGMYIICCCQRNLLKGSWLN